MSEMNDCTHQDLTSDALREYYADCQAIAREEQEEIRDAEAADDQAEQAFRAAIAVPRRDINHKKAAKIAICSAFAVSRFANGVRFQDWPAFIEDAASRHPLDHDTVDKYLRCRLGKFYGGRLTSYCGSALCPCCYVLRVWKAVDRFYGGLNDARVQRLVIDCDDFIEPFDRRPILEKKAAAKIDVNWERYDTEEFRAHLIWVAVREQRLMQVHALAVRPRPLGVLSFWTIWPRPYGWCITRIRLIALPRSHIPIPRKLKQPRSTRLLARRQVFQTVRELSPANLFPTLRAAFRQAVRLQPHDERIISAASLLLTTPLPVHKQHARGVFRGVACHFPRRTIPKWSPLNVKKERPMPRRPPVAALHQLGITVGSQQEFWLTQFVQINDLFPEVTFEMFCERLKTRADVGVDAAQQLTTTSVEQKLKNRDPEAKQPARLDYLSDFIEDQSLFRSQTQSHMSLDVFLTLPPRPANPPLSGSTLPFLDSQPATQSATEAPGVAQEAVSGLATTQTASPAVGTSKTTRKRTTASKPPTSGTPPTSLQRAQLLLVNHKSPIVGKILIAPGPSETGQDRSKQRNLPTIMLLAIVWLSLHGVVLNKQRRERVESDHERQSEFTETSHGLFLGPIYLVPYASLVSSPGEATRCRSNLMHAKTFERTFARD